MQDEVKNKLEELERKISGTDKRIDDFKWAISSLLGLFGVIFAVISVLGSLNFSSERSRIDAQLKDIRDAAHLAQPAKVELFADNGVQLENHRSDGRLIWAKDIKRCQLVIHFIIKNSGEASTGAMYVQVFSDDGVPLDGRSIGEPKYKYEVNLEPDKLNPSAIPGGYMFESFLALDLEEGQEPTKGDHSLLAKVYYGNALVTPAAFTVTTLDRCPMPRNEVPAPSPANN